MIFMSCFSQALNLPGKSKKLAVIFPGIRYSPECPLLYYAQKLCVKEGYEILPLYYSYRQDSVLDQDLKLENFVMETQREAVRLLKDALKNPYKDVVFISKSIGTVLAGIAEKELELKPRQFLMTPLPETFPYMKGMGARGAAVLGTKDKNLSAERLELFCQKEEIPFTLYEGAGHRLEMESMDETFGILSDILKKLREFLAVSC